MNTGLRVTKLLAGGGFVMCIFELLLKILKSKYTFVNVFNNRLHADLVWSTWTRKVCAYGTIQNLESACGFGLD
jgi:hypothetical protein